jgi:hypothetical protein
VQVNLLAAQAQMRGVPLEQFVAQLLAEQVAARSAEAVKPRTPEQIRAWLDSLAQFSNKIPPLPDVSPAWIHQDHDSIGDCLVFGRHESSAAHCTTFRSAPQID